MPSRPLSPRQLQIANMTARGAGDRDIAEALRISYSTVKAHQAAIRDILGVRTRVDYAASLVRYERRQERLLAASLASGGKI